MVRLAAILLFLGIDAWAATSVVSFTSTGSAVGAREASAAGVDPDALVERFERAHRPRADVDLGARYAGRAELLDPRRTLPTWHLHPRAQAAAVYRATRECPPSPTSAPIDDAELAKALAWHARTCAPAAPTPQDFADAPPFMHPSGRSYAALAIARGGVSPSFVRTHVRSLHVLELAALDAAALGLDADADTAALRSLGPREWDAIARGDRVVLSPSSFVVVDRGTLGASRVRVHDRTEWEDAARAASVALVPRRPGASCGRPASSALCWEPLTTAERYRKALAVATTASAALSLVAAAVLAVAYARERRRMHADRVHVLRTLTHELRTPATTLALDVEPLRAAYDALPVACQEPLLRVSDGIARMNRVLHRSAKYMALFESSDVAAAKTLFSPRRHDSAAALMEELAEEWPEGVTMRAQGADGPVTTDGEWLAVAVRNLVENACRHGEPPVEVAWRLDGADLVVRVADAGASPSFSLRRAIAPYQRDPASAGLGLGLAIVARVARLLRGELTHEPSPTVFELRVPAVP